MLDPWKKNYGKSRQHIKKQRHYFANKGPSSQSYGFSSNHVWLWELYHKEGWTPENWCFLTVVLEKTVEKPLNNKEIQLLNPKGNQSWIFPGRTDAEVEAPIHWPPDAKSQLIRKDPDGRKDWRQEEKGTTEDEMAGWHHQLKRHEFEQALGVGEGQGCLGVLQSMGSQGVRHKFLVKWSPFNISCFVVMNFFRFSLSGKFLISLLILKNNLPDREFFLFLPLLWPL